MGIHKLHHFRQSVGRQQSVGVQEKGISWDIVPQVGPLKPQGSKPQVVSISVPPIMGAFYKGNEGERFPYHIGTAIGRSIVYHADLERDAPAFIYGGKAIL